MQDHVSTKELVRALDLLKELKGGEHSGSSRCPDNEFQERLTTFMAKRTRSFLLIWMGLFLIIGSSAGLAVNEFYKIKSVTTEYTDEHKPAFKNLLLVIEELKKEIK